MIVQMMQHTPGRLEIFVNGFATTLSLSTKPRAVTASAMSIPMKSTGIVYLTKFSVWIEASNKICVKTLMFIPISYTSTSGSNTLTDNTNAIPNKPLAKPSLKPNMDIH